MASVSRRPPAPSQTPLRLARSEEHTSELQSLIRLSYAVFCLKKKSNQQKAKYPIYKMLNEKENKLVLTSYYIKSMVNILETSQYMTLNTHTLQKNKE